MSDTPFGPMKKGIVGNRANDPKRVINFPDREWREQFHALRKSTDPIDVSIANDNKSLMREVDRRTDASRSAKKPNIIERTSRFLGLEND